MRNAQLPQGTTACPLYKGRLVIVCVVVADAAVVAGLGLLRRGVVKVEVDHLLITATSVRPQAMRDTRWRSSIKSTSRPKTRCILLKILNLSLTGCPVRRFGPGKYCQYLYPEQEGMEKHFLIAYHLRSSRFVNHPQGLEGFR